MLIIKNGTLIDTHVLEEKENTYLFIDNGKIIEPLEEIPADAEIIDAEGMWISPGLIDIHCHLRDPGFTEKEDLISGTASAVAGGFTTICPMANTRPTVDNLETLEYIQLRSESKAHAQVLQHATISKNMMSQELVDMQSLWEAGAVAFSDDGLPYENLNTLKKGLEMSVHLDAVVVSHAEDLSLAAGGCMREGKTSLELGVKGIPAEAETVALAREIEVLRQIPGAHLHFAHISTKASVELIRRAKADGLNITAETTPHHLISTDELVKEYQAKAKMNPPLGNLEDQEAITQGILDGTLDALATDHAPHTREEKERFIEDAPFGITGFETALGIYLQKFYHSGLMKAPELLACLTSKAAKCLQLKRDTQLLPGKDAYITIIDPNKTWTFTEENTKSKATNSPFYGREFKGKAAYTIVKGEVKYKD